VKGIDYVSKQEQWATWQKLFNQWKHKYTIEVIWYIPIPKSSRVQAMIKRTKI